MNELDRITLLEATEALILKRNQKLRAIIVRLRDELRIIRDLAEPLRYAVTNGTQRFDDRDFISSGEGYLYRGDEDGYLQFIDLKKLIDAIDNNHPELNLPDYED